jgi:hypothetical protein
LVEYDEEFWWDNFKLEEYFQSCASQLSEYTGFIEDTWSTQDGMVLTTRLELDFTQRHDVLNIIISEEVKDVHTRRPVWMNPKIYVMLEPKTF